MTTFSLGQDDFLRDGAPHRILAGAIHYFRVHPGQWRDRVRKAKAMGLNTVETYVAWNSHEPRRGEWDESGWNDLGAFLDIIEEEGMDVIVRPGPYICAEWHNGGLPVWVTGLGARLRSSDPVYLEAVTAYLERVYEIIAPRQVDRGGNVILVQIENEYGAYGSDKAYLAELVRVTRAAGITVPLTTVDQPMDTMIEDGSLPELHKTASFGSRAGERLAILRSHQKTGPLMCSEFWDGWFDWWGGLHHTTEPAAAARELEALLVAGASVNFYMFHGGTNFALTNGANHRGRYLPLATSYDYDAPLDEAGRVTEKFRAFRDVIARYAEVPAWDAELLGPERAEPREDRIVAQSPLIAGGAWAPRRDGTAAEQPQTFDEIGHLSAVIRYDVDLPADFVDGLRTLAFDEVRDMAYVSVDGRPVGTISRTLSQRSIRVPAGAHLSVIVEEQGRVNYDHRLGEPKGLIAPATLDGAALAGWTATPIDVAAAVTADLPAVEGAEPQVWTAAVHLDGSHDVFLETTGWGDGFAAVNGVLLGRFRSTGPQRTLIVPAAVQREGSNTVTVLALDHVLTPTVTLRTEPILGPLME